MKRIVILAVSAALFCLDAESGNKNYSVSAREQKAMTAEADDFIDAIPDGLQDRQRIAVDHAVKGDVSSLADIRKSRDVAPEYPAEVEVRDFIPVSGSASGIKMRLYRPAGREDSSRLPLLVYYHGGGWTFGSLDSCAKYCSAVASSGDAIVLAVDYSLAPEDSFPAGLLDCVAAAEYASAHAEEWGSYPSLLSLGGDSSGGNLALATALLLADDDESAPKADIHSLVLFYPVVSNDSSREGSWCRYGKGYGLDAQLMESFITAYKDDFVAGISEDWMKGLMEPLKADDEIWRRLPKMLVVQAGRDILFDQGREYVEQSRKRGIEVRHVEFTGAVHLFITVDGQPTAFAKAVSLTTDFLKES